VTIQAVMLYRATCEPHRKAPNTNTNRCPLAVAVIADRTAYDVR